MIGNGSVFHGYMAINPKAFKIGKQVILVLIKKPVVIRFHFKVPGWKTSPSFTSITKVATWAPPKLFMNFL